MTSTTFHFKIIYEITIFKFFNFFVRSFVFSTSLFTIFASFFLLFDSLWLIAFYTSLFSLTLLTFDCLQKILFYLILFESKSRIFLFSKKISMCSNRRINFFNFLRKRISKRFCNIVLRKCECNVCRKLKYFWYFSKNSNNCIFNFSICVISL